MHGTYYFEEFEPNLFSKSKSKEETTRLRILSLPRGKKEPYRFAQEPHQKRARKVDGDWRASLVITVWGRRRRERERERNWSGRELKGGRWFLFCVLGIENGYGSQTNLGRWIHVQVSVWTLKKSDGNDVSVSGHPTYGWRNRILPAQIGYSQSGPSLFKAVRSRERLRF